MDEIAKVTTVCASGWGQDSINKAVSISYEPKKLFIHCVLQVGGQFAALGIPAGISGN
jgi:hypothetical protein